MNKQTLEAKIIKVILPEWDFDMPLPSFGAKIIQLFKDEGYEKKHQILYGTKYPDPRPCTKNSHFVEHEQSDCGCGYTKKLTGKADIDRTVSVKGQGFNLTIKYTGEVTTNLNEDELQSAVNTLLTGSLVREAKLYVKELTKGMREK